MDPDVVFFGLSDDGYGSDCAGCEATVASEGVNGFFSGLPLCIVLYSFCN